jgi:TfoX/Sxy family transcriptional regulator of competence genes
MPYDQRLANLMRLDLAAENVSERSMFGGLCFMVDGHMACGVHKAGGMFRVGKANAAAALAVPGARPMTFTGRPMAGLVDVSNELLDDDVRRGQVMAMALGFVRGLPPKVAEPAKPR